MSSLYALGVGLVFVTAGTVLAAEGAHLVAGEQAQTAADLGALAGAAHAIEGAAEACGRAAAVAAANAATVSACRLDGLDLTLTVTVVTGAGAAEATAVAGPVREVVAGEGAVAAPVRTWRRVVLPQACVPSTATTMQSRIGLKRIIAARLGARAKAAADRHRQARHIAAELLGEMRVEIDRLTECLAQDEHEADQLRAELAATRTELASLRARQP
jgi:secretion/DNA translocation related TadE-like protein